jgi:hypothetical protein
MSAAKTTARPDISADIAYLTRALKDPTLPESAARLAERARTENWSHEEHPAACLQREVSARESHGGDGRIRAAPPICSSNWCPPATSAPASSSPPTRPTSVGRGLRRRCRRRSHDRPPPPRRSRRHQRNAKLQLTVLRAPPEAVLDLYRHPEHRRRPSCPALRARFDV